MEMPRLQMSVGSLLLLITVVCLAISHGITSRQLAATRAELMDYRYQYGHLVVDDPARPHVLAYAKQENPWKWHVYFPKGKNYKLLCGVGNVPVAGLPDMSQLQYVQQTFIDGNGQNKTMTVSLTESSPDTLKFSIGCDGAQTVTQIVPKANVYKQSVFTSYSIGKREAFAAEHDQPFVVFFQTERKANTAGASPSSENGVVVWVVPE